MNSQVKGTVTKIADFGCFVRLASGIEGLVHVSELAHHRVKTVSSMVKKGDELDVKILNVDTENQKISLSVKATTPAPEKEEKKAEEKDEPIRELAVKKTDRPLRAERDVTPGGNQFGLKW